MNATKTQHTPGPWKIERIGVGDIEENDSRWMVTGRGRIIADPGADKIGRANARLIAAAPEMLEALRHIARMDLTGNDVEHIATLGRGLQIAARRAIAKAEGGGASDR